MGLLDWASKFKDDLLNGLGSAADFIIPGDQSSWHQNGQPQPTQQQRQTGAAVGAQLGIGPSAAQTAIATAQKASAPAQAKPQTPPPPIFKVAPPPKIALPPGKIPTDGTPLAQDPETVSGLNKFFGVGPETYGTPTYSALSKGPMPSAGAMVSKAVPLNAQGKPTGPVPLNPDQLPAPARPSLPALPTTSATNLAQVQNNVKAQLRAAPVPIPTRGPVSPLDIAAEAAKGIGKSTVDLAQGVAQVAPRVLTSVAQPAADAINTARGLPTSPITFDPKNVPLGQYIFGDKPIGTYQAQADAFSAKLKELGLDPKTADATSIISAPALATLDLFGGGKSKAVTESLAKAGTEDAVKSILTKELGSSADKIPPHIIAAVTAEKDPAKIATILKRPGDAPIAGLETPASAPAATTPIYHGTTPEAAAAIEKSGFDLKKSADGSVWFTSNPKIGDQAASGKGGIVQRGLDESKLKLGGWDEQDKYTTDQLTNMGYDGLKLTDNGETTYKIFNPEKLTGDAKTAAQSVAPTLPKASDTLAPGIRVKAGDRGNFGTIQSVTDDGKYLVKFVNKDQKTVGTKIFAAHEITPTKAALADTNPQTVVHALLGDPSLGPVDSNLAARETGSKARGFTDTVQESPKAAPEVQQGVTGSYNPITNADTLKQADGVINQMGYEQAVEHAKTNDSGDVLNQALSLRVADNLQSQGRYNDAIDVLNKVADRATKNGQDVQILAAYNRLTPEGIVRYAMKGIDDAKKAQPTRYGNLTLAPEQAAALRAQAERVRDMPDGVDKQIATFNMLRDIQKLVPSTATQKAITLWKAGLLTGIKGQLGNQVGNATNTLLRKLADVPAASIDAAIGVLSGQRGKTFTLKGLLSGFGEGIKAAKVQLKHGFDPAAVINDKYDVKGTFFSDKPLGKAAQAYTDTVFRLTAAGDRPHYYSNLRNSLQDQAKAAALTARVPRNERKSWIENFIASPPEAALVQATSDAHEATFANDNAIGQALKGLKRGLKEKGGPVGEIAAEANVPFTGVPSSVATAVINYSPVGGAKAVYDAIKAGRAGEFTPQAQRALSTALGRTVTGLGVAWLGYQLFLDGKFTLGYPQDPQERALWEQEGKQPYSVLVGGKWRSLNYTGPIMAIMGIGGQVASSQQGGADLPSALLSGAGTAGQAAITSSPLKGVQGALDVVNDPGRNAPQYLNSQAGSLVPTLVKDTSNATDGTVRQVDNPLQAVEARLPGVRTGLNPKIDEFGNQVQQDPSGLGAILDPFKSTDATTVPLTDELQRLQDAGQGITPTKQDAKVKLGGQDVKLDPSQLNDYKVAVGQAVTSIWNDITTSDGYSSLDDTAKKAALQKAKDAATTAVNATFSKQNSLGDPAKALSDVNGLAASVLAGTATPAMFTTDPTLYDQTTKLQVLKDTYAADKASGKLSTIEDFKRQKAITAAEKTVGEPTTGQIASKYSKDAVSLAGLSKKDYASLIAGGQISQATINEANAYKAEVKSSRPSTASTGRKSAKVAIKKGGSIKTIKVAKIKAPKMPKIAKVKTNVVKIGRTKVAKVKLPKRAKVA